MLIRVFLCLALVLLTYFPTKAESGTFSDAYPDLKNSYALFFNQLKDEMVTQGTPEEDTDGLIFAWIVDVDACLQDQLEQGLLNKNNFAQKLFESFFSLTLDHMQVTDALISTLSSDYGIGLKDIGEIVSGKKELPADFKPLYEAIKQLYFSVDNDSGNNSGGSGGSAAQPIGSGIGADGGQVIKGGAILDIPKGALTKNVDIIIEKVDRVDVAVTGTFKLAGEIFEFGPSGQQFDKPVTIILEYNPDKLASGEVPIICVYDPATRLWINLGGVVNEAAQTIRIEVTHFTKYAVMVEAKAETLSFKDVASSHWAYKEITDFASKEYIEGYADNTFLPGNNISRAEFAAVLIRALELKEVKPAAASFKDVNSGSWCCSYVETICSKDLMKGYADGSFKPNENITRQEIAAVLVRALGKDKEQAGQLVFADKSAVSGWAKDLVSIAVAEGLIQGYQDNTFGPQKKSTRAEAVIMFSRMLNKKQG
jgi:hypothetical protein